VPDVDKAQAAVLKKTPFLVDAEPPQEKKWYTRNSRNASRFYMMALLAAQNGRPVPHFDKDVVYRELLGIAEKQKIDRKVTPLQYIGDCEWPEDAVPLPAAPKQRPRRRRPRALLQERAVLEDDGSHELGLLAHDDPDDDDTLSSDSSSSSS
jgi:hypothetical protein